MFSNKHKGILAIADNIEMLPGIIVLIKVLIKSLLTSLFHDIIPYYNNPIVTLDSLHINAASMDFFVHTWYNL